MSKTIFEKIIDREVSAEIWYEDHLITVFFDVNPVAFGHSLVISKSPYPWIQDVPPTELGQIFERIPMLVTKLKDATNCDYVQIEILGKDVPHFHIHLIPRLLTDNHSKLHSEDHLLKTKQLDRSKLLEKLIR